jgi:hypothetical protein
MQISYFTSFFSFLAFLISHYHLPYKAIACLISICYILESGSSSSSSKRQRLEQIPASNLDADDPIDEDLHREILGLYSKFSQFNYNADEKIVVVSTFL